MNMELYEITRVPPKPKPAPLDVERVRATLAALKRGEGFTIAAAELRDDRGRFRTRSIGMRVHKIAEALGIRVSTKKTPDGLRVRREK